MSAEYAIKALWEAELPVAVVKEVAERQPAVIEEKKNTYVICGENFIYEISKYTALPILPVLFGGTPRSRCAS